MKVIVKLYLLHVWPGFIRLPCMDIKDAEIGHIEWPNVSEIPTLRLRRDYCVLPSSLDLENATRRRFKEKRKGSHLEKEGRIRGSYLLCECNLSFAV